MKKITFYSLFLAISFTASAQDCATMYDYFKEGVKLEYTNYNKKGKVQSVNTHHVTDISNHADTLIATIAVSGVDEKGKHMFDNAFPMKCYAGTVFMDMRSVMPPMQNDQKSPDMQIEINGTDQMFPGDMKVGQSLPDAEMETTMRMGGLQLMNKKYYIKNRKVEAEETLTTSAGTYKCLKISYDFEFKLMGTRTTHTEYWYSPAVGMVKTISYNKKGKEEGRTELTKVLK